MPRADDPGQAPAGGVNAPLQAVLGRSRSAFEEALRASAPALDVREVGIVQYVERGIAQVSGLPGAGSDELLLLADDVPGLVFNLDPREVGVVLLGDSPHLEAGSQVVATGRRVAVPVGEGLLGRVVDPLGRPLDESGPVDAVARWPVERDAPAIVDRSSVTTPLQSGLKVVDALFPIGRGQRELILGDRQVGKTSLALDAIVNQRDTGVRCVYCAIGQRGTAVARVIDTLREEGMLENSAVVCALGEEPPGLQYIAPYAAMTIAEWFMARGDDVLLVIDDLTRHARAYRELSLLLRRPPGREAYPGDIFYVHSRLLERAAHLCDERGGGSITALPIVETQAGDISAYIPTNLISITDGQLYLAPSLFHRGIMPAVDVGRSVSRVGGKAQRPALRDVAGELRLLYAQFEELESFSRFATRLDQTTRNVIERGRRVRAVLVQRERSPLRVCEQIAVLLCASAGVLDAVPEHEVIHAEELILEAVLRERTDLCERLDAGAPLEHSERDALLDVARRALESMTAHGMQERTSSEHERT